MNMFEAWRAWYNLPEATRIRVLGVIANAAAKEEVNILPSNFEGSTTNGLRVVHELLRRLAER